MGIHLKSPKHLPLYMIIMLFFVIPFKVKASIENTTFSYIRFSPNDSDIKFEGDAYASDPIIELTKNYYAMSSNGSIGRATYHKPLHLWDMSSGNLADFTTHFSFVINSLGNRTKGNGLAFFLAPNGSQIPPFSGHGYLGLYSNSTQTNFVAVEFDTFPSYWDPVGTAEHIGIDLNSLSSVEAVAWSYNAITTGGRIEAWIHYNSSSKNLSVCVTNGAGYMNTIYSYDLYRIVDLKEYLPEWVTFGFTASTELVAFEKHEIYSWDFSSSLKLPEKATSQSSSQVVGLTPSAPQAVAPSPPTSRKRKSEGWLLPVLGISLTLGLIMGLAVFCCWKKRPRQPASIDDEFRTESGPRSFSYKELVFATNNFDNTRMLGKGGFGKVYEGLLTDGKSRVAVKRITSDSRTQGLKEYLSEVNTISRLGHRNLVKLIGWCRKKQGCWRKRQELLIVYELMPNKSLDVRLFNTAYLLSWESRYRIALGLASALCYLQEDCEPYVLHRDVKSSNVLLDSDLNAKLSDFGLARLVEHGQGPHTTRFAGTPGYVAPECYCESSKPSKESDVYSFGIVALEIACGKPAAQEFDRHSMNHEMTLVKWVWEQHGRGSILAAADPRLGQNYSEEGMKRLIIVGLACAHPNPYDRPTIKKAMDMLNDEASLPELPSVMPDPPATAAHQPNVITFSGCSCVGARPGGSEAGQNQFPGTQPSNYTTASSSNTT